MDGNAEIDIYIGIDIVWFSGYIASIRLKGYFANTYIDGDLGLATVVQQVKVFYRK